MARAPAPARRRLPRTGRWIGLPGLLLAALPLPGCSYYEVTRADGTTERISRSEYEDLQRTSRRLGNVPSTRIQRQAGRDAPAAAE